jgi:hypothetical protein
MRTRPGKTLIGVADRFLDFRIAEEHINALGVSSGDDIIGDQIR